MGPATQANPALLNTGPSTSVQLAAVQNLMLMADAKSAGAQPAPASRRPWDFLKVGIRPLLLILIIQAALSARLVWANTAFQDEALYLWSGHVELNDWLHHAHVTDYYAMHFSGAPVIYPPLAAMADSIGGLAAARLLSLIFMLGSTILLYCTATRLFSRRVAIMSAAFFATLGWADQLGAFATFDAMAIFLIALSSWLVVRGRGLLSEPMIILAALFLALADAA
jgi:4-amino-4-deoxy-L-arabinose transferase-like glycosyltransferase